MPERTPQHWSDPYLGRPYDEANCGELAAQVQREVFGRAVTLPAEMPTFVGHQSRLIAALKDDLAEPVAHPDEGDAVLMRCGSLWHVGVYCVIGRPYVLHALKNAGQVTRHKLTDLTRIGLTVEGFYRWT